MKAPQPIVLITNRPEMAAYIETFNTEQTEYRIELHYSPESPVALPSSGPFPDLVISEAIAGNDKIRNFRPLDRLFLEGKLRAREFYSEILKTGRRNNRQYLLPVSFDLPLLMYSSRIPGKENELYFLNLSDLRQFASQYNKKNSDRYVQMGFSPLWYGDFLILVTQLLGTAFTADAEQVIRYNSKNLNLALEFLREWSDRENGGPSKEMQFKETYLTSPPHRQVSLGYARYAYSSASSLFTLPESRRIGVDFRWIGNKGKIQALENILYIGILQKAPNPKGAEAFLRWFFQLNIQKKLLEATKHKFLYSFGLFRGFSSLRSINEEEYPQLYPILIGHIPPEEILEFPPPIPHEWEELKRNILIPFILDTLQGNQNAGSLEARLKSWLLTRPAR
ncbi:MAG: hypothetical protein SNJ78_07045 [Spirochaetales bacterium]